MADYAGAVAAARAYFVARFSASPVAYQNEDQPADPWPPQDGSGRPIPWCYFEMIETDTALRGAGLPGSQTWLTSGHIRIHVFAPKGYGYVEQLAIAKLAGDVFRAATFYNSDPGAKVVCYGPSVRGGETASDDGNWFGVTVTIPFEFFFLG